MAPNFSRMNILFYYFQIFLNAYHFVKSALGETMTLSVSSTSQWRKTGRNNKITAYKSELAGGENLWYRHFSRKLRQNLLQLRIWLSKQSITLCEKEAGAFNSSPDVNRIFLAFSSRGLCWRGEEKVVPWKNECKFIKKYQLKKHEKLSLILYPKNYTIHCWTKI